MIHCAAFTRLFVYSLVLAVLSVSCAPPSGVNAPNQSTASPGATSVPAETVTRLPTLITSPIPPTLPASDIYSNTNTLLKDLTEKGLFSGVVLIARDGSVVLNQGYGLANREEGVPNTPQTRFRIASMTKQFTAMAILILQAQGKLNVQDQICKYLTNCPEAWNPVTIHHLLTHTSGIDSGFDEPEEIIAYAGDEPLVSPPGQEFRYTEVGYILMSQIIEQASGQPYAAFLQDSIFDPLNMAATNFDCGGNDTAVGYANALAPAVKVELPDAHAGAGLCSTAEDLYRWDQALYTEELIGQALLGEMFIPRMTIERPPVQDPSYRGWGYGYGWMIGQEGPRTSSQHTGSISGYVSLIARYPDDRVTIILLSNQASTYIGAIKPLLSQMVFGKE